MANNHRKYIKYKYIILKNFILNPDTSTKHRDYILFFFCKVQKLYNAMIKFKHILSMKLKKYLSEPQDLQFNELIDCNDRLKIDIIQKLLKAAPPSVGVPP